jgi:hypothetical protein
VQRFVRVSVHDSNRGGVQAFVRIHMQACQNLCVQADVRPSERAFLRDIISASESVRAFMVVCE